MNNNYKKFKTYLDIAFDKDTRKDFNDEIDKKTRQYQVQYGFDISDDPKHRTWNNEADAFKHAFMQAVLVNRFNETGSFLGGMYHEIENMLRY